jgi:hypothetical protein
MGAWMRIKQVRWHMWIVAPLAVYGAYSLSIEGLKFYWSWKGYQFERNLAVSEGLAVPTFREYRWDKYLRMDPVMGQLYAKSLCRSGDKAIAELLPPGGQVGARDTLMAFKAQAKLVDDADMMLIAERIDEVHLILKDPKHHTAEELSSWLAKVRDFANMKATYGYHP